MTPGWSDFKMGSIWLSSLYSLRINIFSKLLLLSISPNFYSQDGRRSLIQAWGLSFANVLPLKTLANVFTPNDKFLAIYWLKPLLKMVSMVTREVHHMYFWSSLNFFAFLFWLCTRHPCKCLLYVYIDIRDPSWKPGVVLFWRFPRRLFWSSSQFWQRTRPYTRLPKSRAGGQGQWGNMLTQVFGQEQ